MIYQDGENSIISKHLFYLILDFMNNGVDGSIIRDLIMQRNVQRKLTKPRIFRWKFKRVGFGRFFW